MASTAKGRKKTETKQPQKAKGLTETQRWVIGVVLFIFAVFLLVAVGSYYFCWADDQNIVRWGGAVEGGSSLISNPTGKTGAKLADLIVGRWFGVFGLVVPVVLIILALRIINYKPSFLRRSVRISLITMILGSLTLGFAFGTKWGVFGSGLGGAYGILVSQWVSGYLGQIGTILVLLLGWILLGVYVNSRKTISTVNKVGKGIYDGSVKAGGAVADFVTHKKDFEKDDFSDYNDKQPVAQKAAADAGDATRSGKETQASGAPAQQESVPPPAKASAGGLDVIEVVRPAADEQDRNVFEITGSRDGQHDNSPFEVATWGQGKTAAGEEQKVVMLGDEAGEYVVGIDERGAQAARKAAEEARYAGGVGRYAGEIGAQRVAEGFAGRHTREPSASGGQGGTFEVVDMAGVNGEPVRGATLSVGGVVEASSPGGVKTGDRLEVVVAGHSDAQLADDQIDESLYDPTLELSRYQKPPVEILEDHSVDVQVTEEEIYENKNQIVRTLENFGIKIDKIKATIGPTVTLYEIIPAPGVKISKIKNLEDDIALSLKALGIRIIAPMPGKGTVGIEVPNKDKEIVSMYSVVKTMKFQESSYELPVVLGRTISNETFMIDLAKMPHLLVAGATGQGKSVGLNAIITSLLYKKHPAELKFVMVDPKRVELSLYSKLEKHFLAKMESEEDAILTDTQKVVYTLNALCNEMSERYDLLRAAEVKKISEYNDKFLKRRLNPNKGHRFMPYIVVIVDEFADMIMTAGREVEAPITRLAQLARAVGIHLVIATQRPDVKVITGLIKANFPARVAFRVTSMVDSRTILDQPGANQLIGRGDMLMSINGEVTRVQCAFIDTPEIERIVEFISNQKGYSGAYSLPDYTPEGDSGSKSEDIGRLDDMFEEVARAVVQSQEGSTSWIQRTYSIGYNRAGRITDQLEKAGIVGKSNGSKPREVLIQDVASLEYVFDRLYGE